MSTLWLTAEGAPADGPLLSIRAGPLAKGFVAGEVTGMGAGGALGLGESAGLMDGPHRPTDQADGGASSPRNGFRGERPKAAEGPGDMAKVPGQGKTSEATSMGNSNLWGTESQTSGHAC